MHMCFEPGNTSDLAGAKPKGCRHCGKFFEPNRVDQVYCNRLCKVNARRFRVKLERAPRPPRPPRAAKPYVEREPKSKIRMFPDMLALRCMIAHPNLPEAKALRDRLLPVVIPQPELNRESRRTPPGVPLKQIDIEIVPDWMAFPHNSIRSIQAAVVREFNISQEDLLARRRTREYVVPRHIAMYLCCEMAKHRSLPQIGQRFGNYDHTSVLHARNKIRAMLKTDNDLARRINKLRTIIEEENNAH